jgi:YVTN family beta-propeller protein
MTGREVGMARIAVLAIAAALALGLGAGPSRAQYAYIPNFGDNTVSVIDTTTKAVTATISLPLVGGRGAGPYGAAVTPDGSTVYVANNSNGTVSVIATASNTVIATVPVGNNPRGVAVTPDGGTVYVTNQPDGTISVIDTASNTVTATITGVNSPEGVAVTPDGSTVYVASFFSNTVSVIATASNTVIATIPGFTGPYGVAVTPDGGTVYVTNDGSTFVSVIATASNTVTATIVVGVEPLGVAVSPDGSMVYVARTGNSMERTVVQVIATATNKVVRSPVVDSFPTGVAVTPDGSTVYVANQSSNTVSVVDPRTGVVGRIFVGNGPIALGNFIGPPILTVSETGTGAGLVTSGPAGIDCSASSNQCALGFAYGTPVTLTASASAGSSFAGWSGGGCSGTGTCNITSTANTTVTATFTVIPPVTLTVAEPGSGAGQVTSSPSGINCSAVNNQCAAPFAAGSQVTLTASASAGSSFAGWSGGGCAGTGACVVTMSAAQSVTATFNIIPSFMLSVFPSGSGSGTVTSMPSGINCGGTCNASFQMGTQVVLTAAVVNGSTFAGWSGGGCSGDQSCSVTLGANTTVNASFTADTVGNLTLVAAVLPLSRSVELGATPTAFATMINAGPDNASTCTIAPTIGIPATFLFQTTNPSTNAVTGTANTPVNIAAGQAQSFVIAFMPNAAFPPTNVAFTFTCANAPGPAAATIGVDTLNLSASTTPVPDVVALAASGDPGYVDIPGATGTGVFAVATVNLGIDATITAAANTGTANLPVTLTICQTDPASGACLAAPAPTATTDIQPNATPTFGIFVTGSAAVANLPGVNRVFVTLTDSGGTLRGETSVAVRTQ